eukprot:548216-Lingulodinium_polyedra.AAC.1
MQPDDKILFVRRNRDGETKKLAAGMELKFSEITAVWTIEKNFSETAAYLFNESTGTMCYLNIQFNQDSISGL